MASSKSPLVTLFLGLLFSPLLSSAQPSDTPYPTSTPNFLTQGGGDGIHGAQIRAAPPAPIATPRAANLTLPGPVAAVLASVVTQLRANNNFTILLDLLTNYVNTTALVTELKPPATLFARTDAAFSVIPPNVVEGLKENPDILTNLITYHFVKGFLPAAVLLSFPNGQVTSVFRNQTINTTVTSDGSVVVGVSRPLAKVTQPDVFLVPGVFATHGISMVLTPQRFVVYATTSNETSLNGTQPAPTPIIKGVANNTLPANVTMPSRP